MMRTPGREGPAENKVPEVSIGFPVYNGARSIRRALDSLLSQSFRDFELIISDNNSTDETVDICRSYAEKDSRIRLILQPANVGPMANFRRVLQEARGQYFMWAAADDYWHPQFIEKNCHALAVDPSVVVSMSRVRMGRHRMLDPDEAGTSPLTGSFSSKLVRYLNMPGANTRFYGLYRRKQITSAMIHDSFVGLDWAIMIRLLMAGDAHEVPEELMERSSRGVSSKSMRNQVREMDQSGIHVVLPMLRFTTWVWKSISWRDRWTVLPRLVSLNLRYLQVALLGTGNRKRVVSFFAQIRNTAAGK